MTLPGNQADAGVPAGTTGPVGKMTSGVGEVIVKFVIPVAGFCGGYAMGAQIVTPLADFLVDFVPFLRRMYTTISDQAPGTDISMVIAGLIIVGISMTIGYMVYSLMGGGFLPMLVAVGIISFGIGVGIRGVVEGFGPAKAAIASVLDGGPSTTATTPASGTSATAAAAARRAQEAANAAAVAARDADRARAEAEALRRQRAAQDAILIEERRRAELAAVERERERHRGTGRKGMTRI